MRWKFWKKAAQPQQEQQQQQQQPASALSLNGQKKRRHFEASCIAGADTGDEDFVFESFERRTAFPDQQANLQPPPPSPPPPSPPLPPPPPPPRKKESHTLPRFLRRAASVGRSKAAQADGQGTNGASAGHKATAVVKKVAASSDEGFPSASSGDLLSAEDDSPLAYCPHCRAVVQPLTVKKRSQIRTNPWLKERKRPRIEDDGVMQKSLDSGISGLEDASARTPQSSEPVELTATAAQTDELGDAEPGRFDVVESPGSVINSDSDGSSTPVLDLRQFQPKRKVLRKRRYRHRQLSPEQQQQQQYVQQQQYWEAAYLSSDDEDLAADAEVLAIHASAYAAASQPLSIMAEGIASAGFVPEEQKLNAVAEVTPVSMSSGGDSSSLWWDMDRRHLRLMMAPPPDTSSCSSSLNLTEAAACQTPVLRSDSEGTEFDSPADSDSEMEFELPPPSMLSPLKSTEESVADAVRRLAAQKDSLDRRFRDVGEQSRRSSAAGGRGSLFARELELYRRELLLRALASVRDQLDYQMLELEQRPLPPPSPPSQRTSCLRQASDPNGHRLSIVRCGPGERMSYH